MKKKHLPISSPDAWPRPEPVALAQLAAILSIGKSQPIEVSVRAAMEFYVESVIFTEELSASRGDIVSAFGRSERNKERILREAREIAPFAQRRWMEGTLKLEPWKDSDEVRSFLTERARFYHLPKRSKKKGSKNHWLGTAKTVLRAIREYWRRAPGGAGSADVRESPDALIEGFRQVNEDSQAWYAIPDFVLEGLVKYKRMRVEEGAAQGARTKKNRVNEKIPKKIWRANFSEPFV